MDDEQLRAITVGDMPPTHQRITLTEYDPAWPAWFERAAERIRGALGGTALQIDHVGSTSVPGLPAKPLIDINLLVADAAEEAAYVPQLEAAGYALRIREPEWYEHRMLRGVDPPVNLHVFRSGCAEADRMLLFRDRLRGNESDRDLYARTKRTLAAKNWKHVQDYADAKSDVVRKILASAEGA
ncbi:GrpB family protein [Streptomyces sp. NPDC101151]|uniref:GrpB family protein n=1 Tax=Streptomyces sp. NPDC101151 TaxID=3366115 RepID=UPI003810B283